MLGELFSFRQVLECDREAVALTAMFVLKQEVRRCWEDVVIEHSIPWPHTPTHQLSQNGTYFVTVGAYMKQHFFSGAKRLSVLQRGLLKSAAKYSWRLEAWAVFSNHYHFVGQSPLR